MTMRITSQTLVSYWSPEVPLDVQGQVVWPGERSTADVAFEWLDPSVFPLRGCSDNSLTIRLQVTFVKYLTQTASDKGIKTFICCTWSTISHITKASAGLRMWR